MPEDPQPIRLAVRTNARGIPEAYDVESGRHVAGITAITTHVETGEVARLTLTAFQHDAEGALLTVRGPKRESAHLAPVTVVPGERAAVERPSPKARHPILS